MRRQNSVAYGGRDVAPSGEIQGKIGIGVELNQPNWWLWPIPRNLQQSPGYQGTAQHICFHSNTVGEFVLRVLGGAPNSLLQIKTAERGLWERLPWAQEVPSSNLGAPTKSMSF